MTVRVQTPNAGYSGKTLGVPFHEGVAIVDENTVPKALGRSPDEVVSAMKQDHPEYAIEEMHGRQSFTVPQMPWKKDEAEPEEKKKK